MLRRVVFVRTDVSEERITSNIRVRGISELRKTLAETSNRSSQTSILTIATLRNISDEDIFQVSEYTAYFIASKLSNKSSDSLYNKVAILNLIAEADIATGYVLDDRRMEVRFPLPSTMYIFSESFTQPHTQRISGVFYPEVKLQQREADHSLPTSTEAKKTGTYTST
jgi:hypothetical protein